MSSGPSEDLTTEQFVEACKRVKAMLLKRVSSLKKKDDNRAGADQNMHLKFMQSSEDLYIFEKLLQLCNTLEKENESLSNLIHSLGEVNMVFALEDGADKKKLPN